MVYQYSEHFLSRQFVENLLVAFSFKRVTPKEILSFPKCQTSRVVPRQSRSSPRINYRKRVDKERFINARVQGWLEVRQI